jgi:hypothetical protein
MIFANNTPATATPRNSNADIAFVLGLTPEIVPPTGPGPGTDLPEVTDPGEPPDTGWPPGPDGPDEQYPPGSGKHPGLTTMDLHFGTRRLSAITGTSEFGTLHGAGGLTGFGDALNPGGAPPVPLRVMGVTFQNGVKFDISVQRAAFDNRLGGVNFQLHKYEEPRTVYPTTPEHPALVLLNQTITVPVGVAQPVATAAAEGRYTTSFSGILRNVAPDQVPTGTANSQTVLTWTMVVTG